PTPTLFPYTTLFRSKLPLRFLQFVWRWIKGLPQIASKHGLENFRAEIHLLAKHWLGAVELQPHVHVLGALSWKHEYHRRVLLLRSEEHTSELQSPDH